MGIRFYCPNGHKLNVKTFLAGKRGICPQCRAKFQIPLQSDPRLLASDSSIDAEKSDFQGKTSQNTDLAPPSAPSSTAESVVGTKQRASRPATEQAPVVAASTALDPISEAPQAVWYVRPASGGQYGPATADIMRSWIGEGRVSGNTLVWREGWEEWKTANTVFPGISAPTTVSADAPRGEFPAIVTGESVARQIAHPIRRKSKKSNNLIVGFLVVACVALFFVLLAVLRK